MKKSVFIRDEILARLNVSESELAAWENARILKPIGYTDHHVPFYSEKALEMIEHVKKLMLSGYGIEEIQKIIKKVGLPKAVRKAEKESEKEKARYLTVGVLAERADVSPRTVKHWEDKGIIEPDMWSEGGFRLYSEGYVLLCQLIKDLQLFGYTLEEIKVISDYYREYLAMQNDLALYPKKEAAGRLEAMLKEIETLMSKVALLKEGIKRWEDLAKKKKKEILALKDKNQKRPDNGKKAQGEKK